MTEKITLPKRKRYVAILTVVAVLGLGLGLFYLVESGRLAAGRPVCSVCNRPLHPAQTFMVVSKDGRKHLSCCPRCGLRFALENKAKVKQATDFGSGKLIAPESAYYLEGSDVMGCCNSSTMRADGGMFCEMHYDRCMPSMVTFAEKDAAEDFQHQHGGRVISFTGALQSIQQQLTP